MPKKKWIWQRKSFYRFEVMDETLDNMAVFYMSRITKEWYKRDVFGKVPFDLTSPEFLSRKPGTKVGRPAKAEKAKNMVLRVEKATSDAFNKLSLPDRKELIEKCLERCRTDYEDVADSVSIPLTLPSRLVDIIRQVDMIDFIRAIDLDNLPTIKKRSETNEHSRRIRLSLPTALGKQLKAMSFPMRAYVVERALDEVEVRGEEALTQLISQGLSKEDFEQFQSIDNDVLRHVIKEELGHI